MKSNDERLTEILKRLDHISYIKLDKIPEISLYTVSYTHLDVYKRQTQMSPCLN